MAGDGCRAELFAEEHRGALRAACAEDKDIWDIYTLDFGPDGFDRSIDLLRNYPKTCTFVLFEDDELAGMSSFIHVSEGRQTLEIGGTLLSAAPPRHRLQPPRQGHDARPRLRLRSPTR